ncbi:hypothetical protein ACFQX7_40300 [Luedemannella flava]
MGFELTHHPGHDDVAGGVGTGAQLTTLIISMVREHQAKAKANKAEQPQKAAKRLFRLRRKARTRFLWVGGLLILAGWYLPAYVAIYHPPDLSKSGLVAKQGYVTINGHRFDYFFQAFNEFYIGSYNGPYLLDHPTVHAVAGASKLVLGTGIALVVLAMLIRMFDAHSSSAGIRAVARGLAGLPSILLLPLVGVVLLNMRSVLADDAATNALKQAFIASVGGGARAVSAARDVAIHLSIGFAVVLLGLAVAAVGAVTGQKSDGLIQQLQADAHAAQAGGVVAALRVLTTIAKIAIVVGLLAAFVYIARHTLS